MKSATERYRTDSSFKQLVDMLQLLVRDGQFTPSELREACVLAATINEYQTIRPMLVDRDNLDIENIVLNSLRPKPDTTT